ncbi:MAG: alpha-E domain-containing protein [Rhodobiaceae bacterium]
MLGRVANNLYWMARYLERAENNARLIETAFRRSLSQADNANDEWAAVLSLMGARDDYDALHETCDQTQVTNFLLREKSNPASVLKLVQRARQNGRIGRTALTTEAWQAINDLWLALEKSLKRPVGGHDLPQILSQVRQGNALVRGALDGTMLRNDIFNFIRLGMLVERGDNTARLLNARYFLFLPSASVLHQENGFAQWDMVLSALGAMRAYNWLHKGRMEAPRVLDFLIADKRMPRSLHYCYQDIVRQLDALEEAYGCNYETTRTAQAICADFDTPKMAELVNFGLQDFIAGFLAANAGLSDQLETDFKFNPIG